jgi:outer membrane protein TolC
MRNRSLLLLTILFSIWSQAQEKKGEFTLKEAVNYALKHNRSVKNASLEVQAAEHEKWETTTIGLPKIDGKIDYMNNIKTPFDAQEPAAADEGPDIFSFMFPKHSIKPDITLTQLIFDGTYLVGLEASNVFLDISKLAKEKTDSAIKEAVVNAYTNASLTEKSLVIMNRNIDALKSSLQETTKIFENGMTEEEDLEQLQLTLSNLENNLENIKNLQKISMGYVKLLLGIETNEKLLLTESLDDLVENHISMNLISNNQSIFNNLDYKIAKNDTESNRLLYKLEKYRSLPSVSGFLSTNYQSFTNDSFSSLFNDNSALGGKWVNTTTAGVSINIPIFSSFESRARRKKTKLKWEISQNKLEETEDQIELDILQVKSEYNLAISTYENKQKGLKLAERIENKNTIKFKEGIATSFELRQAQTQLYSIQQEYLESMMNVINKKAELENILNIK